MTDAGFFKGTSAEQDARFADKRKKLLKTMKFGENLTQKVDMSKVNLESLRPWIIKRITELLNFEDEVVCDYVFNQLEERFPDPKEIQINITGFLNSKNARIFLSELWDLLISAMQTTDGVPAAFLEAKKAEICRRQEEEVRIRNDLVRREEEIKKAFLQSGTRVVTETKPEKRADETSEKSKRPRTRSQSKSSASSGHRRRRRRSSHKRSEKSSRRSKHREDEDSRRRRSRTEEEMVSGDNGLENKKRSKRHRISHSREVSGRKSAERASSETDWRKDAMAGRRRSPPQMPVFENGHVAHNEERLVSPDRKSSRDHRSERVREHASLEEHKYSRDAERRSRRSRDRLECGDLSDPRKDYRTRRYSPPVPDDRYYRYREERRYHDSRRRTHGSRSRSGTPRRHHEYSNQADRANKFHARRAQWAQEEDAEVIIGNNVAESSNSSRRRSKEGQYNISKYSRIPEGPDLPPDVSHRHSSRTDVFSTHRQKVLSRASSASSTSSSSSDSSSSSSSSDDGESSASTASSSSSSDDSSSNSETELGVPAPTEVNTTTTAQVNVNSQPHVEHVPSPEGPALPPPTEDIPEWTDHRSAGSRNESSEESGSDSSSTASSDRLSVLSDVDTRKRREYRGSSRNEHSSPIESIVPEGPEAPSSAMQSGSSSTDRHSRQRGSSDSVESMEEALRQRALASLMRSGGQRRVDSRR